MIPLSVQVQVNVNEENDEEEDDDDNCVLIRYNEFLEVYKTPLRNLFVKDEPIKLF